MRLETHLVAANERFQNLMNIDRHDPPLSRPRLRCDGTNGSGVLSRRRLLMTTGAMAGAALWGGRPVVARQATPVASPVSTTRDWRDERWVGTWAAAMHAPSAGFGEEFPSQFFEFDKQTVRQIVRTSIGGDQVRVRLANTFGDIPLVIGAARLALRDVDERID
ncbi:MAG: GDSL-like Lipase/Acylhydrolase, partial [Thermomicrobiales bacterium]|nr:GDSL-like Lipase/Acylhydrolase [Thermomicrobiales bacterium]